MPMQPLLFTCWLPRYSVQSCVTYRMPCHSIDHQALPIQPLPREAEDFPWGDKHFKHVLPLTYLMCFSPKGAYMVGPIYMPKSPQRTLISLSLVLNQRFKSPITIRFVLTIRLESLVSSDKISKAIHNSSMITKTKFAVCHR